jgi:hypothetical protein
MQKWLYDIIQMNLRSEHTHEGLDDRRKMLQTLEEQGQEGWELVSVQMAAEQVYLFLKTPLADAAAGSMKPQRKGLLAFLKAA